VREKSMNAFMRAVAALVLLVAVSCAIPPAGPEPAPTTFTVLFFNDLHGHLRPFSVQTNQGKNEVGGIARLATLVKTIRAENARAGAKTVLLVAGDILQGTPMSTTFHGKPDVSCFNRMGVDAVTIGNHEFDFGLANFKQLQEQATFPFISANIVLRENGRRLAPSHVEVQIADDIRLTIVGVTTRELTTTTRPDNVTDLAVLDPTQSAVDTLVRLSPDGPVLLLSHCKHRTDRNSAAAMPQLAAIIAGHDQILFSPHRSAGNVPIFQAFEKGRYLGRLDFQVDKASGTARLIGSTYIPVTAGIPEDTEVAGIVDRYAGLLDARFNETIGRAAVFLDGERQRIRWEETNLGNFVADVMRLHTGAQIALINAGSLRASIDSGEITVADVFTAMPYTNELIRIDLSGKEIQAVLDRGARGRREEEDGGFLHVSGLTFTIADRRAANIMLTPDDRPLDPEVTYRVAIPAFLYDGGDGYTFFRDKPAVRTGLPLRELLVDTIRKQKVISARIEGRIRRAAPP
jgi:5'-nucleotidase/UDP-sugar diphosphatase